MCVYVIMSEQKIRVDESNRMWANASFVGVLIVVGLPLWWKTTEVYRVALPYDKIGSFDPLSHRVPSDLTVLAYDRGSAEQLATLLAKEFKDYDILKLNIKTAVLTDDLINTLNSVAEEQEAIEELARTLDLTKHNNLYLVQRKPLFKEVWLAGDRVVFFRDDKAAPSLVKALKQWVYQPSVLGGATSDEPDVNRQTRFPPGADYHIVLSVVNPAPDKLKVEFDAGEAVEDYVGSFADELAELHNFTLKSQWLYLLDFDFHTTLVNDASEWGHHYSVRQSRLPQLLTRLEERLATRAAGEPVVNLVLYTVPCQNAPLVIYGHDDRKIPSPVQAFMSPRWGGVLLGSPSVTDCAGEIPTWRPDPKVVMGTFMAQLRKLMGITEKGEISGAYLEPLRSVVPRRWEVDALLRIRTLEQISSAERTLHSLAQLLGEISNIVINDEVGASIKSAVEGLERADLWLKEGDLLAAHKTSLEAYLAAEAAFFDPSLLALLYFPDDQKYAIYIPLFLPIMFPVVLSLKSLLLWCRGKPMHKEKID